MPSPNDNRPVVPRAASVSVTAQQLNTIPPRPTQRVQQNDIPLLIANTQNNATVTDAIVNDGSSLSTAASSPHYTVFNTESNRRYIKDAVNNVLFHRMKFISSRTDLMYSTDKHSIAQIILTSINVPSDPTTQCTCWAQIRHLIPAMLNRKRTTVTFAIKKKFEGAYDYTIDTNIIYVDSHICYSQGTLPNTANLI